MMELSYEQIRKCLRETTEEEWTINQITTFKISSYSYVDALIIFNDDARVVLAERSRHSEEQETSFTESWAQQHPNPEAHLQAIDVLVCGIPVISQDFVRIDGYQGILPKPKLDLKGSPITMVEPPFKWYLTQEQAKTGRLISNILGHNFEYDLHLCGLGIEYEVEAMAFDKIHDGAKIELKS